MKTTKLSMAIALILSGAMATSVAFAKGKPTTGESGVNNLSFPLILSDNVGPAAFPADGIWKWATITNPSTQCIGETGVTPGTAVDPTSCATTAARSTSSRRRARSSSPATTKVWWLQKRTPEFLEGAERRPSTLDTPLVVSAVDIGDLLESSPSIATRQIRVEFNLLQSVPDRPRLGSYVADWTDYTGGLPLPAPCTVPDVAGESIGCFAAFGDERGRARHRAVRQRDAGQRLRSWSYGRAYRHSDPARPDHGAGWRHSGWRASQSARSCTRTARACSSRRSRDPVWNPAHRSVGRRQRPGGQHSRPTRPYAWTVETTSGGSIVYGYNWNAKTATTGTYRLTFVLDGNDTKGPICSRNWGRSSTRGEPNL